MFTFVKSAAKNWKRREIIRRTWGSAKWIDEAQFSTIFVIGKTTAETTQVLVDEESSRYEDIFQINSSDDYSSVNRKTFAGMQWASENLDNNTFYSTADDDMMVNLCKLKQFIDELIARTSENKWSEFPIICTYEKAKSWDPIRKVKDKNFVSEKQYKWAKYPNFCLGGMYTTSVNIARQLYEISRTQLLLNTDDVLITGVWRNILGMPDDMLIETEPKLAEHLSYHFNRWSNNESLKFISNKWFEFFNNCSESSCKSV